MWKIQGQSHVGGYRSYRRSSFAMIYVYQGPGRMKRRQKTKTKPFEARQYSQLVPPAC
jgi:hypothetical protein